MKLAAGLTVFWLSSAWRTSLPTYGWPTPKHGDRLVRYGDDFVICVADSRQHAEAPITETAEVLRSLGLTLSRQKTRITRIEDGLSRESRRRVPTFDGAGGF